MFPCTVHCALCCLVSSLPVLLNGWVVQHKQRFDAVSLVCQQTIAPLVTKPTDDSLEQAFPEEQTVLVPSHT